MRSYWLCRYLSQEAGGWSEAASLPYQEAFAWATEKLRKEKDEAFRWRTLCWAAGLGLYAMSGNPPPPPKREEDGNG